MSVGNLPPDFLYNKIPTAVLNEDVRRLLRAVVGGFQDKLAEMRTLADQIREVWMPDNSVGEPYPVVVVTYNDPDTSESRQITLNVNDSTPDQSASTNSIFSWCASEMKMDPAQITGAEFTTDQARTAETRTLQLLADTIGAKLYENLSTVESEVIENQKRALKTYFARLKVKGTAQSFDLLGRLHGFDDVKFIPLWGRVSPRIPNSVGAPENDADFSQDPQGQPTPGQITVLYDPNVLNDGDIFTWQSGLLSANESQTDFILEGVNGFNPYITVQAVGATPNNEISLPAPGTYYLKGGAFGAKATTGVMVNSAGTSSGLAFVAIADGASFNGTQIVVTQSTGSDNQVRVSITVYHNLSAIKFRTSYFNLSAAVSYDSYAADNTSTAQTSPDLQTDPSLWHDLESRFPANSVPFANDGVANDPFRPWTGGAKPLPIVQTWPDLSITDGSGTPSSRVQASVDTPALDVTVLRAGGTRLTGNIDDVRPVTRYLRTFRDGLSVSTDVEYAPHISRKALVSISAATTYAGSAGTLGVDYPTLPYVGSFVVSVRVQTFTLAMSPVSDTTTEYSVSSESLPATPTTVDLSFTHPSDSNLLAFTGTYNFAAGTYSVTATKCGYTGVSNVFVVTATFYGLWQAVGTDRLQKEPPAAIQFADTRHYQPVPEDELETKYIYTLNDSYPWRRALVGGGETLVQNEDNYEKDSLRQLLVRSVVQVEDESQLVYDVIGVDFNLRDRGYVVLNQNTADVLGQQAVGFRMATLISAQSNEEEHSGALSTVLIGQLGSPYEVGAVKGVLVADPATHWTPAHSHGLVAWFHCGEHPLQPYLLLDHSNNALSEVEIEAGAFSSNYLLADRVWDAKRGWMLRLRGQKTNQTAGFFSVNKERLTGNDYAISFWAKSASHGLSTLAETPVFTFGPVTIKLGVSGGAAYLQTYVVDAVSGIPRATGSQLTLSDSDSTFYSFSVASLNPTNPIQASVCSLTNLTSLEGFQVIDGIQLVSGMSVLVAGQTNQIENGHYFVSDTLWYRIEPVDGVDERGQFFQVLGGNSNSGMYQNLQGLNISPINYGTDFVSYARLNCTWNGAIGSSDQDLFKPFGSTDTLLKFAAVPVNNSPDIIISDLRIWDKYKTNDELTAVQTPQFKVTAVSARPTFFTSTRGDYRAFEVLESGYVFPSVKPIDFYLERLVKASRYNGRGEYVGPDSRLQVGYGDWKPAPDSMTLGLAGPDFKSQGTSVAASTSSMLPGFNSFWYADATSGHYRRVPVPYISGSGSDNTTLIADPTSLYHPTEMPVQNPTQARIYVPGDDGNMYRVVVHVAHSNAGDTVELVAQLAGQMSLDSQLTEQNYVISSGDTDVEIYTQADFYDLVIGYPTEDELQQAFMTDARTLVSKHTSSGPACITDTGTFINALDGQPDGPLSGTRNASMQRMVLVAADSNKVVFINTATNTVAATITLATGYADGSRFKQVAFATSTQNFFILKSDFSGMIVTDVDGNIVGTLSPPVGYNFSNDFVYSPETDKLYTIAFNGGTSSDHILEFDPHTLGSTRDVDTGNADNHAIFYYPNNIVLYSGGFMRNYPTSTLTVDKTGPFFQAMGHMDYDPISQRLFVGQMFTNNIVAFKTSDLSLDTTFTPVTNSAPYEFISYNPVTKAIIGYNYSMEITVIDPALNTIVCETNNLDPAGSGGDMAIDYSTGKVYLFDEDWIHNPVKVFI